MAVFDCIDYWRDEIPRSGAENMAVDQLLMELVGQRGLDRPILRIYEWSEPTVTFGYFLPRSDASSAFPDNGDEALTYVRRWTGGGVVDHRVDMTYTLMVPRAHELATSRGAESYRVIHQAVADGLNALGERVRLTVVDEGDGAAACFANPVAYDLTDMEGLKVAGAGQRRTKYGLLHQGSVMTGVEIDPFSKALQAEFSDQIRPWSPEPSLLEAARQLASQRYATDAWNER